MLIVLLIFALCRTLQGVPLSSPANATNDFATFAPRDIQSHLGERSTQEIVISCFATILACTWSAFHPNIPAPTDCWWTQFKNQVTMMICALLAPELITVWALRQHIGAKIIRDQYNEKILDDIRKGPSILDRIKSVPHAIKGLFRDSPMPDLSPHGPRWTMAHGFFLQMGGFMLSDHGKPIHTLLDDTRAAKPEEIKRTLIYSIQQQIVDPPQTTEEDIQDRSKGDLISKIVIILQTTWFVAQCIVRWAEHLPVTELEVITLGFAMLNVITYILWLDKPQNVGRPVFLQIKNSLPDYDVITFPIAASSVTSFSDESSSENSKFEGQDSESGVLYLINARKRPVRKASWLWRKLRISSFLPTIPIILPCQHLLMDFMGLDGHAVADKYRVTVFYTANIAQTSISIAISVIGALFAIVHLIPFWFLDFSSSQEMWLWGVSSMIITVQPVLLGLLVCSDSNTSTLTGKIANILSDILIISFPLYPISRIILFVLSLISLRSLSPDALQAIKWTTFIPHL